MFWVIGIVCAIVGTYLYVMGLCYLCDLYEAKKQRKQQEEEKRRKEELRRAVDEAEMRRKAETERRRRMADARKQRSRHAPQRPSGNSGRQVRRAAGA